MDVGPYGRGRTHPCQSHREEYVKRKIGIGSCREVVIVERLCDVCHRNVERLIADFQHAIEEGRSQQRFIGQHLSAWSKRPCSQDWIVIIHGDDERVWARSPAQLGEDLQQIRADRAERRGDAAPIDTV